MPGGGVLARFIGLGGWGFELSFCPRGGELVHKKTALEFCRGGDGHATL